MIPWPACRLSRQPDQTGQTCRRLIRRRRCYTNPRDTIKARQVYSPNRPDELPLRLRKAAQMVKWIAFAYQMGDDSYLSLTGGKPLFAATVSYSPDGA